MANNSIEILRENIKKYRKAKGYTQIKLSLLAGLTSNYVSEIERGRYVPSLKKMFQIAEALGIEPYKLLM